MTEMFCREDGEERRISVAVLVTIPIVEVVFLLWAILILCGRIVEFGLGEVCCRMPRTQTLLPRQEGGRLVGIQRRQWGVFDASPGSPGPEERGEHGW